MVKEQPYLASLKEKHLELDKSIEKEMSSPTADTAKVSKMKKQKLQIKEEIAKLSKK